MEIMAFRDRAAHIRIWSLESCIHQEDRQAVLENFSIAAGFPVQQADGLVMFEWSAQLLFSRVSEHDAYSVHFCVHYLPETCN
jgi:hypothetical protein